MLIIKGAPEVFEFRERFDVFIVKIDWGVSTWNECWSEANWFGSFWNPLLYLRKIGILLCFLRKLSTRRGDWVVITAKINISTLRPPRHQTVFKGILPKGRYQPCVSMVGRALLAGYHHILKCIFLNKNCCLLIQIALNLYMGALYQKYYSMAPSIHPSVNCVRNNSKINFQNHFPFGHKVYRDIYGCYLSKVFSLGSHWSNLGLLWCKAHEHVLWSQTALVVVWGSWINARLAW